MPELSRILCSQMNKTFIGRFLLTESDLLRGQLLLICSIANIDSESIIVGQLETITVLIKYFK